MSPVYLLINTAKLSVGKILEVRRLLEVKGLPYLQFNGSPNYGPGLYVKLRSSTVINSLVGLATLHEVTMGKLTDEQTIQWLAAKFNKQEEVVGLPADLTPTTFIKVKLTTTEEDFPWLIDELNSVFGKYKSERGWDIPQVNGSINYLIPALGTHASVWAVFNMSDEVKDGDTLRAGGIEVSKYHKPTPSIKMMDMEIKEAEKPKSQMNVPLNSITIEVNRDHEPTYSELLATFGEATMVTDDHQVIARWNLCKDFKFPDGYDKAQAAVYVENILYSLQNVTRHVAAHGHISVEGITGLYGYTPEEDIVKPSCLKKDVPPPAPKYVANVKFNGEQVYLVIDARSTMGGVHLTNVPLMNKEQLEKFVTWLEGWLITVEIMTTETQTLLDAAIPLFKESLAVIRRDVNEVLLKYTPPKSSAEFESSKKPSVSYCREVADVFLFEVSIEVRNVVYFD